MQHIEEQSLSVSICPQVVYDEATNQVWLMLHSGSRNIGNKTAQHHDGVAKHWLTENGLTTPAGLNYAPIASEQGQQYLQVIEAPGLQPLTAHGCGACMWKLFAACVSRHLPCVLAMQI